MPNGKGWPACFVCAFYDHGQKTRPCTKHDFVMPAVVYEPICSDWQVGQSYENEPFVQALLQQHFDEFFRSLLPGHLYYSSYASRRGPEGLGAFEEITRLILGVCTVDDTEFGWVMFLSGHHMYELFPAPGREVAVRHGETERLFKVVEVPTRHQWMTALETERLVHCQDAPATLREWIEESCDTEALVQGHKALGIEDPMITILLEVIERHGAYEFHHDYLAYGEHRRIKRGSE